MSMTWNDRYEEKGVLGNGGSGTVYLVWDKKEQREAALKCYKNASIAKQEIYILKKLSFYAFPKVLDEGKEKDTVFFVMSYIEGESLAKVLHQRKLNRKEIYAYAFQLCEMFFYLHSRMPAIIYRDLKPDNLILQEDGTLFLIDFGAAREYKGGQKEDTVLLGTKQFAAPEQFGGQGQSDERTDIYAIGKVLLALCVCASKERIKRELNCIIEQCTRPKREERYRNVTFLWRDLKKAKRKKTYSKKKRVIFCVMGILLLGCFLYGKNKKENVEWEKQSAFYETCERMLYDSQNQSLDEQTRILDEIKEKLGKGEEEGKTKEGEKETIARQKEFFFHIAKVYVQLLLLGQDVSFSQSTIEQYFDESDAFLAHSYKVLLQKDGKCIGATKEIKQALDELSGYIDTLPISNARIQERSALLAFCSHIERFSTIQQQWNAYIKKAQDDINKLQDQRKQEEEKRKEANTKEKEKKESEEARAVSDPKVEKEQQKGDTGIDITGENDIQWKKLFYENVLSYWIKMEEYVGKEGEEKENECIKRQVDCIKRLEDITEKDEWLRWKKREVSLTRVLLEKGALTKEDNAQLKKTLQALITSYPKDVDFQSEYGLFLLHVEGDKKEAMKVYKAIEQYFRTEQSESFFLLEEEILGAS